MNVSKKQNTKRPRERSESTSHEDSSIPKLLTYLAPNPFLPTTAVIAVQSAFSLFQLINPAPVAAAAATMTAAAPRISASELFVDEAAVEAGAALKDRMTVG